MGFILVLLKAFMSRLMSMFLGEELSFAPMILSSVISKQRLSFIVSKIN